MPEERAANNAVSDVSITTETAKTCVGDLIRIQVVFFDKETDCYVGVYCGMTIPMTHSQLANALRELAAKIDG